MIPWQTLDRAIVPGYGELTLHQRGALFVIRLDGQELMGSHDHGSEDLLATLGCDGLPARADARVLIGGLGLGYTLRAVLDAVGPSACVEVAELVGATVRWNRGPLAHLAGHPLDDPRTLVVERDVVDVIADARGSYDAIMLDVDNGPDTTGDWGNPGLYSDEGLRRILRALRPGGCVAIWAASETPAFIDALRATGLLSECVRARRRGTTNQARRAVKTNQARRAVKTNQARRAVKTNQARRAVKTNRHVVWFGRMPNARGAKPRSR